MPGDTTVLLTAVQALSAGLVRVTGGAVPDEYRELERYRQTVTTAADGYFRLPPLSRVVAVRLRASRTQAAFAEHDLAPDYAAGEHRIDFITPDHQRPPRRIQLEDVMPEYLAPAVYVEEVDTGSRPIEGVSVSVAGMVGVTERGPVGVPILITSFDGFARWFGQRLDRVAFLNASGRTAISPTPSRGSSSTAASSSSSPGCST